MVAEPTQVAPLISILSSDEAISNGVFSRLSAGWLCRGRRLCRAANRLIAAYTKQAFNLEKRLARFFSAPLSFRRLQAQTGTIISGSFALQFFDRTYYASSDLDLYLYLRNRRAVGRWLIRDGYRFTPARSQNVDFEVAVLPWKQRSSFIYTMPGVAEIYTFHKPQSNGSPPLKVQLIVARRAPMEVVLGFHSTCVMNVISYEKAYCLFPRATLEDHRSLLSYSSQGRSTRRAEGLVKYAQRGFTMGHHLPLEETLIRMGKSPFTLGPRWLGDADTAVISLDINGIPPQAPINLYSPAMRRDPVAMTSFSMRHDPMHGAIMTFEVVESKALRYSCTVGNDDLADHLRRVLTAKEMENQATTIEYYLDDLILWDAELPGICHNFVRTESERKLSCLRNSG